MKHHVKDEMDTYLCSMLDRGATVPHLDQDYIYFFTMKLSKTSATNYNLTKSKRPPMASQLTCLTISEAGPSSTAHIARSANGP